MQNFCFCQLSMQILWRRRCSRVDDLKLPNRHWQTRLPVFAGGIEALFIESSIPLERDEQRKLSLKQQT